LQAGRKTISPSSWSKVLIQPQARTGLGQYGGERGLAHLKRVPAEVVAVQLDQVEGVEEDAGVVPPIADAVGS
jgi:hypothetical protein